MTRIFVNRKSEVTTYMLSYQEKGFTTYRTRLNCNCAEGRNRRSGILVINPDTLVLTAKVIRCRGCVNRKEDGNV